VKDWSKEVLPKLNQGREALPKIITASSRQRSTAQAYFGNSKGYILRFIFQAEREKEVALPLQACCAIL
jgi:hypothetical protein